MQFRFSHFISSFEELQLCLFLFQGRIKMEHKVGICTGSCAVVEQAGNIKAKLKAPRNKWIKAEYNTCVAQVSCHLSRQLFSMGKALLC